MNFSLLILAEKSFNAFISEGSMFIYAACNWYFYKSNVKRVKENDYSNIFILVNTDVLSFDNQCYICLTCPKSLKKKNLQCHAAANIFIIFEEKVKKDISTLNILEKELTYQRLLLKNSNKTKKGLPKLKGTTVNLAVDVSDTVKKCTIY